MERGSINGWIGDTSANISKIKRFVSSVDHSFITTDPSALNLSKKFC